MRGRRLLGLSAVVILLASACGDDGGDGGGSSSPAGGGGTTTSAAPTTTTIAVVDPDAVDVEAMCDVIASTPVVEGDSGVESALRRQLDRWSSVAPVAPDLLADHAAVLAAFYERGIAVREEFDFDTVALGRSGRTGETVATAEEEIAMIQLDAAVATLCDQDPPGVFELVEVDEAMIAFCSHFARNGTVISGETIGSPAYNEEFWGGRADLWAEAVELAPDDLAEAVEAFEARYQRIVEVYTDLEWDTSAGIGDVARAREATPEEMGALMTVSDYLFEQCEVNETGDLGAQYLPTR